MVLGLVVVGTTSADAPTPIDCTSAAILDAIAQGGSFAFDCSGTIDATTADGETPAPFVVPGGTSVSFDASGQDVTIDGQNLTQVFVVDAGASLTLTSMTVTNGYDLGTAGFSGASGGAGAFGEDGETCGTNGGTGDDGTPGAIGEDGAEGDGGAITNAGALSLSNVAVTDSTAEGGNGSDGSPGGSGGGGGNGYSPQQLNVDDCTDGMAGDGGNGGAGADGALGGDGADARGGAISSTGTLSIENSSFTGDQAIAGSGGDGGGGGAGGAGGNAGSGVENNQAADYTASDGGSGGDGGDAGSGAGGGNGGTAYGGAIFSSGPTTIDSTTFTNDLAEAGNGGDGGDGGTAGACGGFQTVSYCAENEADLGGAGGDGGSPGSVGNQPLPAGLAGDAGQSAGNSGAGGAGGNAGVGAGGALFATDQTAITSSQFTDDSVSGGQGGSGGDGGDGGPGLNGAQGGTGGCMNPNLDQNPGWGCLPSANATPGTDASNAGGGGIGGNGGNGAGGAIDSSATTNSTLTIASTTFDANDADGGIAGDGGYGGTGGTGGTGGPGQGECLNGDDQPCTGAQATAGADGGGGSDGGTGAENGTSGGASGGAIESAVAITLDGQLVAASDNSDSDFLNNTVTIGTVDVNCGTNSSVGCPGLGGPGGQGGPGGDAPMDGEDELAPEGQDGASGQQGGDGVENPAQLNVSAADPDVEIANPQSGGATQTTTTSTTPVGVTPPETTPPTTTPTTPLCGGVSCTARPTVVLKASLKSGRVGTKYSASVAEAGGTGPYTLGVVSGQLPPGLKLALATGVISGTPTKAGTYKFVLRATDSLGDTATQSERIVIGKKPAGARKHTGKVHMPSRSVLKAALVDNISFLKGSLQQLKQLKGSYGTFVLATNVEIDVLSKEVLYANLPLFQAALAAWRNHEQDTQDDIARLVALEERALAADQVLYNALQHPAGKNIPKLYQAALAAGNDTKKSGYELTKNYRWFITGFKWLEAQVLKNTPIAKVPYAKQLLDATVKQMGNVLKDLQKQTEI